MFPFVLHLFATIYLVVREKYIARRGHLNNFLSISRVAGATVTPFFFSRALIKTWRSSRGDGSREVRVLSPFSLTLSLFSAALLVRSLLFLSPLDSFYSQSLATSLCHSEKATALTSRSRRHFFFLVDLPLLAEDPLALALISSTHLWSCVTSRRLVYPDWALFVYVTPFPFGLHKRVADSYLNVSRKTRMDTHRDRNLMEAISRPPRVRVI